MVSLMNLEEERKFRCWNFIENIEGKSIASIFYSILGSLEEHVKKERKEAFAAKLKYDQAEKDLDYVKSQISSLASERLSYVDCQKEYDRLYAQKKEELIKGTGETAQKILEIPDSLNLASINLKEVKEAYRHKHQYGYYY